MYLHCVPYARRVLSHLNSLGAILLLVERVWVGRIFFRSGLLKLDDWGNTLFLFTDEFHVPILPPESAAYASTAVELTCPVLLFVGLGARLAILPMLAMTAVIQFTYTESPEHVLWAFLLITILVFGPGKLSIDHFLERKVFGAKVCPTLKS